MTVKIVFYHNFICLLWQNYSANRFEIFCSTRYRSWDCKSYKFSKWSKTEYYAFWGKKREKSENHISLRRIFKDPPYDPKINISVLNYSCKCYNFSTYGDFLKTSPKKSYGESNKRRAILPPPLGQRGLIMIIFLWPLICVRLLIMNKCRYKNNKSYFTCKYNVPTST